MIGTSQLVSNEVYIDIQYLFKQKKIKVQEKNMSCDCALNFDQ